MHAHGGINLQEAARAEVSQVLQALGTSARGLSDSEAERRLREIGPNAVRSVGARPILVLLRQVRNPLLILLLAAAVVSMSTGQRVDALIVLSIVALSVGLGFVNEYRSERAVEELHQGIRHAALVVRDGRPGRVDVTELVPGDVVLLAVGTVVPADLRLLESNGLQCDESVLTGESAPVEKTPAPCTPRAPLDLSCCAFMGTVVTAGSGRGVVVATGAESIFGTLAERLGERPAVTAFEQGLSRFSMLLVRVTALLVVSIFAVNLAIGRPLLDTLLFALAIAVGLTPELLPAIVTVSLAVGARRLAARSVLVKRLVTIEDLGNVEVLFTDKTGTLTQGTLRFHAALDAQGKPAPHVFALGLACTEVVEARGEVVGGNSLDRALWQAADAGVERFRRVDVAPFDYHTRVISVLVEDPSGQRRVLTKGAPEAVLRRCRAVPHGAHELLASLFARGRRVVAVAERPVGNDAALTVAQQQDLTFAGLLVFEDPPKDSAREALQRLARLGVSVKVVTGDNEIVTRQICGTLGLEAPRALLGDRIEQMSDPELSAALAATTIFARVSPEQKSRIIRLQRQRGADVGFLGDGVNDAIALHDADVGISVESAADVAKDAADIVLLRKDLAVLADGVIEGRRIFTNTIKYVLMGTSSNFGNMLSAAGASFVLPFLPMLPTQILLNNLLYDVSELAIPTDRVDEELLERPARWDTGLIRRFMTFFGLISSLYDFLTFFLMLSLFGADERLFHTGWFVESLATQALVIFVIRTRRVPFVRSRPGLLLTVTTLACVLAATALPFTPIAPWLGFVPLPARLLGLLAAMIVTYLALAQIGILLFFRVREGGTVSVERTRQERSVHRLAVRWSRPATPRRHRRIRSHAARKHAKGVAA